MAGRPPKLLQLYGTPEALQAKVDEFFSLRKEEKTPVTIAGLALHLDVDYETIRDGLSEGRDYESDQGAEWAKGPFGDVIKKARARLAEAYEQLLHAGKPVGAIFWLKGTGHIKEQTTVNLALDADSWAGAVAASREFKGKKRSKGVVLGASQDSPQEKA